MILVKLSLSSFLTKTRKVKRGFFNALCFFTQLSSAIFILKPLCLLFATSYQNTFLSSFRRELSCQSGQSLLLLLQYIARSRENRFGAEEKEKMRLIETEKGVKKETMAVSE